MQSALKLQNVFSFGRTMRRNVTYYGNYASFHEKQMSTEKEHDK